MKEHGIDSLELALEHIVFSSLNKDTTIGVIVSSHYDSRTTIMEKIIKYLGKLKEHNINKYTHREIKMENGSRIIIGTDSGVTFTAENLDMLFVLSEYTPYATISALMPGLLANNGELYIFDVNK